MSKVASLSYKKSQKLLQSLRDQQRHSLGKGFESTNILLSPKYCLKDKDLRKIHKAARDGDAARLQQLLLGKCGVNDRDKKKRCQGPRGEGLWRGRALCARKPPDMKYLLLMSQMENMSSFYRELFQVKENTKLLIIHTYLCFGKQPWPCHASKNTLLQALEL